jgi:hypothetical protein
MRWVRRTLVALALFMLLWTPAAACSAAFFQDTVACPGEASVTAIMTENVLSKISPACADALGPEVLQLIQERLSQRKDAYHEMSFSVVPWSQAAEDELRANEPALIECGYQRWQRSGNWLVSQDAVRPYCNEVSSVCGPIIRLSWIKFMGFALIHPGAQTWPYALGGGLALLGTAFWLIRLGHRRQLAAFLRPNWALGAGLAATLIVVSCTVGISLVDIAAWTSILYLLACSLRWSRGPLQFNNQ